jgi:hypothetical protein
MHTRTSVNMLWCLQVFMALLTFKMASPAGKDCKDPTGKVRRPSKHGVHCSNIAGQPAESRHQQ